MNLENLEQKSNIDLKNYSSSNGYPEIVCFPENEVAKLRIPLAAKSHLLHIGLPKWTAPHLYFGPFRDDDQSLRWFPQLDSWPWLSDLQNIPPKSLASKIVIGSQESPIIIESDGAIYLLDDQTDFRPILVNTSVDRLFRSLIYFTFFIDCYPNLFEEKNAHSEETKKISDAIEKIDKLAVKDGSFWAKEIASLEIKS